MGGERRKTSGGKGRGGEEDPPLHVAARAGDIVAVRTICSSNPLSVNARDRHSRTPYPSPPPLFDYFHSEPSGSFDLRFSDRFPEN